MYVTETLDGWVKGCGLYFTRRLLKPGLKGAGGAGKEK